MVVANVVEEHQQKNGFQGSQNDLAKLVIKATECGWGTAHNAIKEAIKDGYIKVKLVDGVKYFEC
jgi:hypothetical protein